MLHSDVSGKVIACAMAVHGSLGNGFQELVYHRALEIEFRYAGLRFESEKEMKVLPGRTHRRSSRGFLG